MGEGDVDAQAEEEGDPGTREDPGAGEEDVEIYSKEEDGVGAGFQYLAKSVQRHPVGACCVWNWGAENDGKLGVALEERVVEEVDDPVVKQCVKVGAKDVKQEKGGGNEEGDSG